MAKISHHTCTNAPLTFIKCQKVDMANSFKVHIVFPVPKAVYDVCRLQTVGCRHFSFILSSQLFSFALLRANRKQSNLGDIQADHDAVLAQM